ncbi:hypothetical protein ONS95_008992 [Cadophora gregata]|uniref:uncharacterized protein n=1 Tax=Cadophora gregata TaxID=51156 RepID=UPI0026DAE05A|nr:uncharacterized protein ONS95_008992 [Cadophora gregata]KAK0124003.1 hypothetical protein ONS95_008992 [Cadophora gregata]KAK0130341.1 hypothetical protein ONS96_000863 [Cadophora gregata f. sp. sojae]
MSALETAGQKASANPYDFLTRLPQRAPPGTDFTAHMTVWKNGQGGQCQTNIQLARSIGKFLHSMHVAMCEAQGTAVSPTPWTVIPMSPIQGPLPQPLEIEISCKTADMWNNDEPANEVEKLMRGRTLIDEILWKHLQALSDHQDIETIFSCLLGFVLKYPATPTAGVETYHKLHVQSFHIPELEQWQRWEKETVKTKFYDGPLLALDQIADIFLAYDPVIQMIPCSSSELTPITRAVQGLKVASGALPDVKARLPRSKDLDRSSVDNLIRECYPPVLRSMEDALEALRDLAMETSQYILSMISYPAAKMSLPSQEDTTSAIH